MALEEFMPMINYIPGEKNVVADALSHLLTDDTLIDDDDLFIDECLDLSQDLHEFVIPLNFR
jgi:hypothetical protein